MVVVDNSTVSTPLQISTDMEKVKIQIVVVHIETVKQFMVFCNGCTQFHSLYTTANIYLHGKGQNSNCCCAY